MTMFLASVNVWCHLSCNDVDHSLITHWTLIDHSLIQVLMGRWRNKFFQRKEKRKSVTFAENNSEDQLRLPRGFTSPYIINRKICVSVCATGPYLLLNGDSYWHAVFCKGFPDDVILPLYALEISWIRESVILIVILCRPSLAPFPFSFDDKKEQPHNTYLPTLSLRRVPLY